jgi:hypothetical protein
MSKKKFSAAFEIYFNYLLYKLTKVNSITVPSIPSKLGTQKEILNWELKYSYKVGIKKLVEVLDTN